MKKLIYLPLLLLISCGEKAPETCKYRLQMYGSEEFKTEVTDVIAGSLYNQTHTKLILPYIKISDSLDCGYRVSDTIKVVEKNAVILQKLENDK